MTVKLAATLVPINEIGPPTVALRFVTGHGIVLASARNQVSDGSTRRPEFGRELHHRTTPAPSRLRH
jgi:hypothetical protein